MKNLSNRYLNLNELERENAKFKGVRIKSIKSNFGIVLQAGSNLQ